MKSAAFLLVALAACGDTVKDTATAPDAGGSTTAPTAGPTGTVMPASSCNVPPAAACKAPQHIATSAAFVAAVMAPGWHRPGNAFAPGEDFIADADLEIDVGDIPAPPPEQAPCSDNGCVEFQVDSSQPGVACKSPQSSARCTPVLIAKGTRFRAQPELVLWQPYPHFVPTVRFYAACTESCPADQRLCPTTHLCMPADDPNNPIAWSSYCVKCEGHDTNFCECRNPDCSMKPAGVACAFDTGTDFGANGTCSASGCKRMP